MSKFKLFIENFLVYGFGGIISKIIPLIMVPIVTRLMPDSSYYGISDMSNTIISFASALAILGMYDAMFRIFFDKEDIEHKKNICSTTLIFTVVISVITSIMVIIFKNQINKVFFEGRDYNFLIYIISTAVLVTATNSIISAPTRMQNKKKVYLIVNTISPIISYAIAIPLLLKGYYMIALPLASAISGIIIEVTFWRLNNKWFSFRRFDSKLLKQLLVIAIPLVPNFLIYWIFNSFDKVMITNMLSIGESGVYAVGSKIGNISQLIYTAFAGGWQYFSFSTMKEKNQVKSNSLVFEYLAIVSYIATIIMCTFSFSIFKILFEEEYLRAYIFAPYLFMAPLLQMLFQVACNQFLVVKKTWPNLIILLVGALVNIFLNYNLIPILGIEGASLSTLIGYIISDVIVIIVLSKMNLMYINKRMIFSAILMIFYLINWRLLFKDYLIINILSMFIFIGIYLIIYREELIFIKNKLKKKEVN